ncbi:MAG TPA: dephospho-CoA kinase, partial [Anaeromyxobacteraceae bacterium]
MRLVGLTGGIATGKTTFAAALRDLGAPVVDADQLARAAVAKGSPGLAAVVAEFGAGVLSPDGELDRRRMAA